MAFLGVHYSLPTYWHSLSPIHKSSATLDCICPFAFDINEAQGIPLVRKWRLNVWPNRSCYMIIWEGLHSGSSEELLLDGVVSYTENEDLTRLKESQYTPAACRFVTHVIVFRAQARVSSYQYLSSEESLAYPRNPSFPWMPLCVSDTVLGLQGSS